MAIFNYRRVPYAESRAFSVHCLTATGSFLAFLAVVAAGSYQFEAMWWWLGAALFVDGIDGPIARKLNVQAVLPNWSGAMLDNIIDYVTYALIPAYGLYQSGMIGPIASFIAAGLIVISSAIYYANTDIKTEENFFSGFPVAWNMLVFSLFVIQPPAWISMLLILLSVVLSFLPINFVHPVRVKRLRLFNLGALAIWLIFGILSLFMHFDSPAWINWLVALSGIYLYVIGAVLQKYPALGR